MRQNLAILTMTFMPYLLLGLFMIPLIMLFPDPSQRGTLALGLFCGALPSTVAITICIFHYCIRRSALATIAPAPTAATNPPTPIVTSPLISRIRPEQQPPQDAELELVHRPNNLP